MPKADLQPCVTRTVFDADPKCVLVVEDDETIRSLIAEVLDRAGYEVESAADGLQALANSNPHDGRHRARLDDARHGWLALPAAHAPAPRPPRDPGRHHVGEPCSVSAGLELFVRIRVSEMPDRG
jgi:hypothetical protein